MYEKNLIAWFSDPGSTPEYTADYRQFLANYIKSTGVKSVLDLGCGGWQFSCLMDWSEIEYLGIDVCESLIERNSRLHATKNITFACNDIINDTDNSFSFDLVIIKDLLQHLSFDSIRSILSKLTNCRAVLMIQDICLINSDCVDGGYRGVDITLPPLNFLARPIFNFGDEYQKTAYEWIPSFKEDNRVREVITLLRNVSEGHTTRYGPKSDGGYVTPSLNYSKIISIGIGSNIEFELDYFSSNPNCEFHLFDHVIDKPPSYIDSSTFTKIGLGSGLIDRSLSLQDILTQCHCGPHEIALLKVDCEGGEWDCQWEQADFSRIHALIIEIHDLGNVIISPVQLGILSKIYSEYDCLNIHPNNYGGTFILDGHTIPRVIELSFIRKNMRQGMTPNTPENYPCSPNNPELDFRV